MKTLFFFLLTLFLQVTVVFSQYTVSQKVISSGSSTSLGDGYTNLSIVGETGNHTGTNGAAFLNLGGYVYMLNNPPVANAGVYTPVYEDDVVNLSGSLSLDLDGDLIKTYTWLSQTMGLSTTTGNANYQIKAPLVDVTTIYTFSLIVNDGQENSQKSYGSVEVRPAIPPQDGMIETAYHVVCANDFKDSFKPEYRAIFSNQAKVTQYQWEVKSPNAKIATKNSNVVSLFFDNTLPGATIVTLFLTANIPLCSTPAILSYNIIVDNDCVLPGDVNHDGVVDFATDAAFLQVAEMVYIRQQMNVNPNYSGIPRTSGYSGYDWKYKGAESWLLTPLGSAIDLKHADCDGNGSINYSIRKDFSISTIPNTDGEIIVVNDGLDLTKLLKGGDVLNKDVELKITPIDTSSNSHFVFGVSLSTKQSVYSLNSIAFVLNINTLLSNTSFVSLQNSVLENSSNISSVGIASFINSNNSKTQWYVSLGLKNMENINCKDLEICRFECFNPLSSSILASISKAGIVKYTGESDKIVGDTISFKLKTSDISESFYSDIQCYPNPTTDIINIVLERGFVSTIELFDIYGKPIKKTEYKEKQSNIKYSMGNIASGIYFARISSSDHTLIKKILKNQ